MNGSNEPVILFKLDLQLESYAEDFLWEDTGYECVPSGTRG